MKVQLLDMVIPIGLAMRESLRALRYVVLFVLWTAVHAVAAIPMALMLVGAYYRRSVIAAENPMWLISDVPERQRRVKNGVKGAIVAAYAPIQGGTSYNKHNVLWENGKTTTESEPAYRGLHHKDKLDVPPVSSVKVPRVPRVRFPLYPAP